MISFSDSSIYLETHLKNGDRFDLYFSYDKILMIVVYSDEDKTLVKRYPVNRDFTLYTQFRQDVPLFVKEIELSGINDKKAGNLSDSVFLLLKASDQLKIASRFSTISYLVEAPGLVFYGIAYWLNAYPLIVPGMGLTIGGMDMGKFNLMPIVKAKRTLKQGLSSGQFPTAYAASIKQVNKAITLSAISLVLNVCGEVLLSVGVFQDPDDTPGRLMVAGGLALSCAGVITSVFSTVRLSDARKALGENFGSIGLQTGRDGLGIVYNLP